jgi:hypothetical protein
LHARRVMRVDSRPAYMSIGPRAVEGQW